jgi:hypothetical protein
VFGEERKKETKNIDPSSFVVYYPFDLLYTIVRSIESSREREREREDFKVVPKQFESSSLYLATVAT